MRGPPASPAREAYAATGHLRSMWDALKLGIWVLWLQGLRWPHCHQRPACVAALSQDLPAP